MQIARQRDAIRSTRRGGKTRRILGRINMMMRFMQMTCLTISYRCGLRSKRTGMHTPLDRPSVLNIYYSLARRSVGQSDRHKIEIAFDKHKCRERYLRAGELCDANFWLYDASTCVIKPSTSTTFDGSSGCAIFDSVALVRNKLFAK